MLFCVSSSAFLFSRIRKRIDTMKRILSDKKLKELAECFSIEEETIEDILTNVFRSNLYIVNTLSKSTLIDIIEQY